MFSTNTTAGTASDTTVIAFPAVTAGGFNGYWQPTSSIAPSNEAAVLTGTSIKGWGWAMDTPLEAADQATIEAGTFTLAFTYLRTDTLLHVDRTFLLYWVLYRVSSTGTVLQRILETNSAVLTVTITAQTGTLSLATVSPVVMAAGNRLYSEVFMDCTNPLQVNATNAIFRIQGTNGRLSAVPNYTKQFARSEADSAPAVDTLTRQATYARPLADSAPASDTLTRTVLFPRALADLAPAADGGLTRRFTGGRALADSAPASDALTRLWTGARSLADSAPASDTLARRFTGARSLADTVTAVSDTLTRLATFRRSLADVAPASDALMRLWTGFRALNDSAPASDTLGRAVVYARPLTDDLLTCPPCVCPPTPPPSWITVDGWQSWHVAGRHYTRVG